MILLALAFVPASFAFTSITVYQANDITNSVGVYSIEFTTGATHNVNSIHIDFPAGFSFSSSTLDLVTSTNLAPGTLSASGQTIIYKFKAAQVSEPFGRTIQLVIGGITAPAVSPRSSANQAFTVSVSTWYALTLEESGTSSAFYVRQITGADIATSSNLEISSALLNCGYGPFASGGADCLQVNGQTTINGNTILNGLTTTETILPATNNLYDLGSISDYWAHFYVTNLITGSLGLSGNPASLYASVPGANLKIFTSNGGSSSGSVLIFTGTATTSSGGVTISTGSAPTAGSITLSPGGIAELTVAPGGPVTVANGLTVTAGNIVFNANPITSVGSITASGTISSSAATAFKNSGNTFSVDNLGNIYGTALWLTASITSSNAAFSITDSTLGGSISLSTFSGAGLTGGLVIQSGTSSTGASGSLTINSGNAVTTSGSLTLRTGTGATTGSIDLIVPHGTVTGEILLEVGGSTQLTVTGSSPEVSVANDFAVGGISTLTGVLNANGGITTTSGPLTISSATGTVTVTSGDTLGLSGDDVSGNPTFTNGLTVTSGQTVTASGVTISGNPSFSGGLQIANSQEITFGSSGSISFGDDGVATIGSSSFPAASVGTNTVTSDSSHDLALQRGGSSSTQLSVASAAVVLGSSVNTLTTPDSTLVLQAGETSGQDVTIGTTTVSFGASENTLQFASGTSGTIQSQGAGTLTLNSATGPMTFNIGGATQVEISSTYLTAFNALAVEDGDFAAGNAPGYFGIITSYDTYGTAGLGVAPIYYADSITIGTAGSGSTAIGAGLSAPLTGLYVVNCAISTNSGWGGTFAQCEVSWTDNNGNSQDTTFGSALAGPSEATFDGQATIWVQAGATITVYVSHSSLPLGSTTRGIATISELT
jgi:hypothetical protein